MDDASNPRTRSRHEDVPRETVLDRFRCIEAPGFDLGGPADHFVDWTNPPNPWLDPWPALGAVARATTTLRPRPRVARTPLRDPATFARQALTPDPISCGRIELGLGIASDPRRTRRSRSRTGSTSRPLRGRP